MRWWVSALVCASLGCAAQDDGPRDAELGPFGPEIDLVLHARKLRLNWLMECGVADPPAEQPEIRRYRAHSGWMIDEKAFDWFGDTFVLKGYWYGQEEGGAESTLRRFYGAETNHLENLARALVVLHQVVGEADGFLKRTWRTSVPRIRASIA